MELLTVIDFKVYSPEVFREFIPSLKDKPLPIVGGFTYITEEQYNDVIKK